MSTCISRQGEYSDHGPLDDEFYCTWCGVLDEGAMRRGVEAAVREKVARRIFEEEQACSAALAAYPLSPYLSGKLSGLQRARDLAEGGDPS